MSIVIDLFKKVRNRIRYQQLRVFVLECAIDSTMEYYKTKPSYENDLAIRQSTNFQDFAKVRGLDTDKSQSKQNSLYLRRLKRGDECWILYKHGVPISSLWTSTGLISVDTVAYKLQLDESTFAIYDVYTVESERRKGHYEALLINLFWHMRDRGFSRAVLWVMSHNVSAIRTHIHYGFERVVMEIQYTSFAGFSRNGKILTDYNAEGLIRE